MTDDIPASVLLLVPFLENAGSALGPNVENGPKASIEDGMLVMIGQSKFAV